MEWDKIKKGSKGFFNWLWNSDSVISYIVFLAIIFVIVKFIFLPGLGLIFGTSLPLAIVESSSMEHYALEQTTGNFDICGTNYGKKAYLDAEEYWKTCGSWYEQNTNINKSAFQSFKLSNGFRKGDLVIIFGKKPENIKVGDILIFVTNRAHPIIHRVISTNPLETKGDHNPGQLEEEKNIKQEQIIGVAVAKIPYIGWVKLFFVELFNRLKS